MRYDVRLITKEGRFIVGSWKRQQYAAAIAYAKESADGIGSDYLMEVKDTYTSEIVATFNGGDKNEEETG